MLASRGASSNFLGYNGFPAVICASVNDELVHGIPNERPLHEGDVLSIDCGAIVNGWHGDAAFTMGVGAIDADSQNFDEHAAAVRDLIDRRFRHLDEMGRILYTWFDCNCFHN